MLHFKLRIMDEDIRHLCNLIYSGQYGPAKIIAQKKGVKVMMGFGSLWTVSGDIPRTFSRLSADPKLRKALVSQLASLVLEKNFDGLFVKWYFPGCPNASSRYFYYLNCA